MKIYRKSKILLVAILALLLAAPSGAAVVSGVRFASRVQNDGVDLMLRGVGLLRYMVVIKAYVGALYLPEDTPSNDVLTDVPKHLEVEYFHAIKGEDFGPATIKSLKKNIDSQTLSQLMPRVKYHNSLYLDVRPGPGFDSHRLTTIRIRIDINKIQNEPNLA